MSSNLVQKRKLFDFFVFWALVIVSLVLCWSLWRIFSCGIAYRAITIEAQQSSTQWSFKIQRIDDTNVTAATQENQNVSSVVQQVQSNEH